VPRRNSGASVTAMAWMLGVREPKPKPLSTPAVAMDQTAGSREQAEARHEDGQRGVDNRIVAPAVVDPAHEQARDQHCHRVNQEEHARSGGDSLLQRV
jgi:hypothetical protein